MKQGNKAAPSIKVCKKEPDITTILQLFSGFFSYEHDKQGPVPINTGTTMDIYIYAGVKIYSSASFLL